MSLPSKTGYEVFCDLIYTGKIDCSKVAIEVAAQVVVGFMWYSFIFGKTWVYWNTADKGLKRPEQWTQRYPFLVNMAMTIFAAVLRTLTIVAFAHSVGANTLCMYQQIGCFVAGIALMNIHQYFWEQRPYQIWLIDAGNQLTLALVASSVQFYLKDYKLPF